MRANKTCHLFSGHAHSLDAELAVAHVEKVFQVRSQEVDDQDVMQPLRAIVLNLRDSNCRESRGKPESRWTDKPRRGQ